MQITQGTTSAHLPGAPWELSLEGTSLKQENAHGPVRHCFGTQHASTAIRPAACKDQTSHDNASSSEEQQQLLLLLPSAVHWLMSTCLTSTPAGALPALW